MFVRVTFIDDYQFSLLPPVNGHTPRMIADELHAAGWSLAWVKANQAGGEVWIVDASRDGKRIIVHAEEITAAFLQIEMQTREFLLPDRSASATGVN